MIPLSLWLLWSKNCSTPINDQHIAVVRMSTGARSAGGFQVFETIYSSAENLTYYCIHDVPRSSVPRENTEMSVFDFLGASMAGKMPDRATGARLASIAKKRMRDEQTKRSATREMQSNESRFRHSTR